MKESILYVNYIIDGMLSAIPTKMIYEESNENEIKNIRYEINLKNRHFVSDASDATEYAIINLQRVLPPNISIACCQSCRHGNFCPYGDYDNEIFCLKDMTANNKEDVCKLFSEKFDLLDTKKRKLLDICINYKPISDDEYYTYNNWKHNTKR